MRVSHDKEMKRVSFWLTKQERENNELFEKIKKTSEEYKKIDKKYKIVVFVSGNVKLDSVTADLLDRNKAI